MAYILPEFATSGSNELEPSQALKDDGWNAGDAPPAQVFNWLGRNTYEALAALQARAQVQSMRADGAKLGELAPGVATSSAGRAVGIAADGTILAVCNTGGTNDRTFSKSEDGGQTFTIVNNDAGNGTGNATSIHLSKNGWALHLATNGPSWYSSAAPYTSWTKVATALGGFNQPGPVIDTVFGGVDRVVAIANNGAVGNVEIIYTASTSRPTVDGDFSTLDLNSIFGTSLYDIASDGTRVVVIGAHGGSARIAWALVSAGTVVGDWNTVDLPNGGVGRVVAWNGRRFVAVTGTATTLYVYTSDDGVTWVESQQLSATSYPRRAVADLETGFIVLDGATLTTISNERFASPDGLGFAKVAEIADLVMFNGLFTGYLDPGTRGLVGFSSDTFARFMRTF